MERFRRVNLRWAMVWIAMVAMVMALVVQTRRATEREGRLQAEIDRLRDLTEIDAVFKTLPGGNMTDPYVVHDILEYDIMETAFISTFVDVLLATDARRILPVLVERAGDAGRFAWDEFFFAEHHNPHTQKAYMAAVKRFLAW